MQLCQVLEHGEALLEVPLGHYVTEFRVCLVRSVLDPACAVLVRAIKPGLARACKVPRLDLPPPWCALHAVDAPGNVRVYHLPNFPADGHVHVRVRVDDLADGLHGHGVVRARAVPLDAGVARPLHVGCPVVHTMCPGTLVDAGERGSVYHVPAPTAASRCVTVVAPGQATIVRCAWANGGLPQASSGMGQLRPWACGLGHAVHASPPGDVLEVAVDRAPPRGGALAFTVIDETSLAWGYGCPGLPEWSAPPAPTAA